MTRKPNRPERKPKKKRGPKPGHQGRSRRRQEPHVIAASRSAAAIQGVMDSAAPEVGLSDCFSAQLKAPAAARQLCHAHQLRYLQYAIDAERSEFAYQMQRLLLRAQGLAKHRADLPPDVFADQVRDVENLCEQLLSGPVAGRHAGRLQRRYRKHREALFTFLYRADVSPDNNACERALRKSKVSSYNLQVSHELW